MVGLEEIWKPIDGFEGLYEVSNMGRVKSLERYARNHSVLQKRPERILKTNIRNNARPMVVLCKNGKTYPRLVHRLVACAFLPNPENKPVVDHIDTNPANNCVDNLRWVTTQENCLNPLTRIHNSESKKGHPGYLDHHTEETKEKLRQLNLGRKYSDEAKKHMSIAHIKSEKARQQSRNNIRYAHEANIGKHRSDETRQKISIKRKQYFARIKEESKCV